MALIHRIWAGPPMPDDYHRFGEKWAELNPDCRVVDWTEEQILDTEWVNQSVVDDLYRRDEGRRTVELFAQLADVVDYELVYRFGGTYVNCDIEPVRALVDLPVSERDAWVASEDDRFVVNAAMGAPTGHGFFAEVIAELPRRYWADPTGPMNRTTGPWLLTEVADRHPQLVTRLPTVTFNPYHWKTIRRGADAGGRTIPAATVGVHHWGHRRDGRTNRIER